ncbi:MAG: hypothetical protein ABI851_14695 [Saprospiraceae bacterium]
MMDHFLLIIRVLTLILMVQKGFAQNENDPKKLDQELIDETTNINLSNELRDEDNSMMYSRHPLSVEKLQLLDLNQFTFLQEQDRQLIWEYLEKHKPLISLLELQSIPGIELDKIKTLIPLLKIGTNPASIYSSKEQLWKDFGGRISLRWARKFPDDQVFDLPDSSNSAFQGSADKLFLRIGLEHRGVYSAGLVAEKDEGERLWSKTSPVGLDYLSAYLFLEKIHPKVSSLVLGDYRMRIGQGIILDNSFIGSSFLDLGYLAKSAEFLKPYHSLQENNMLRGAAVKLIVSKNSTLNLFYSKSKVDANTGLDTLDIAISESRVLSSILTSGLHRTKSEIIDRNSLGIIYQGAALKHNFKHAYLGFSLVNSFQDLKQTDDLALYKLLTPEIQNQWYCSVFHQLNYKGVLAFGELATDQNYHLATIQGILKGLGKYADIALVYRNFSPSFNSRMSQVFSSSGKSQNEKGFLTSFNFFINKETRFNLSWNSWHHPWLKYRVDLPSNGQEFSARLSFTRKRKWISYIQYTYRIKEQNILNDNENQLESILNQNIRVHAELKLNKDWTWRVRAESHLYNVSGSNEIGYLVYQDLIYKSVEQWFSGNFRIGLFQTDSYNTRIYAFENDMLYQFRIPAYYGTGAISYINIRTRINNKFLFEMRFALSYSGFENNSNEIENSYAKELKLQLHYSFH